MEKERGRERIWVKPIYFSKVQYTEGRGCGYLHNCILLNLVEKELSYQVFKWKKQMPAIECGENFEINGYIFEDDYAVPGRMMKNAKNNFQYQLIRSDAFDQEVVFSYAIKLTNEQLNKILPYCNALVFEPYRNRKMAMNDEGYIGYRDEVDLFFSAVTDSYIPKMEIQMSFFYDEEHIWPCEKLYRYLVKTYFEKNKKLKEWRLTYGGHSLFY